MLQFNEFEVHSIESDGLRQDHEYILVQRSRVSGAAQFRVEEIVGEGSREMFRC